MGEGIAEGEIVKWHVKEGDVVKEDGVLLEVETDKAVVQIPSPRAGTIARIHHKEGDTVKVGEVLVSIAEKGEKISDAGVVRQPEQPKLASTPPVVKKEEHYTASVVGEIEEAPPGVVMDRHIGQISKTEKHEQKIQATPGVRRLARDLHVDLTKVVGSGAEGRVTEQDVRNSAEKKGVTEEQPAVTISKKYDFFGFIERIPLKGVRKATAEHMAKSIYTATHVTHMDEVDVTDLATLREKEKARLARENVKLTYLPFIVKAVIAALKEHPMLSASLDDEHQEIIVKKYYNIGIAVDTPDGLIVPVVKEAQIKSIVQLAKEIQDYADRAAARKLDIMDLKGGSFTITNIGSLGGIFATPIINYPECAIMALGKIYDKVVFKDEKIQVRKALPFSVAFDHRVLDGAECARFANAFKEHLEDPEWMLLEGQ